MKKTFGLIRIDGVSDNDMRQAVNVLTEGLSIARKKINGGADVNITWADGNDSQQVEQAIGKMTRHLALWSDNRLPEKKRKSLWTKLADELNGLLDE